MVGFDLVDPADRSLAGLGVGEFEAVESGLAGEGAPPVDAATVETEGIDFAHAQGDHGVASKGVVVVEILIAHCHAEDALTQKLRHGVLDEFWSPVVGEAGGKLVDESGAQIDLPQQEHPTVGTDVAPLEIGLHFGGHRGLEKRRFAGYSPSCGGLVLRVKH